MDEFEKARQAAKKFAKSDKDKAIRSRKKFLGYSRAEIKEAERKRKGRRKKKRKT